MNPIKTVFVVSYGWHYEGTSVQAVYATSELAEQHLKGGEFTIIDEMPVLTEVKK